jgi:hypothetical protein
VEDGNYPPMIQIPGCDEHSFLPDSSKILNPYNIRISSALFRCVKSKNETIFVLCNQVYLVSYSGSKWVQGYLQGENLHH